MSRFVPLDELLKLSLFISREIAHHAAQFFDHAFSTGIPVFTAIASHAIMRGGKNKMAIDCISAYLTTKVLAERMAMELDTSKEVTE